MSHRGWIGSSLLLVMVVAVGVGLAAWKYASIQETLAASANQHYDLRAAGYSDQGKMELIAPAEYAASAPPPAWAGRVAPRERHVAQALRLLTLPSGVPESHQTTHSWLRTGPQTGLRW